MSFEIVNETYVCLSGEDPKRMGYIEGYTSNTVGKTYLRLNIKSRMDKEYLDWYKRCFKEIPKDIIEYDDHCRGYLRERKEGDLVGDGIRLNRKQVIQLIWQLLKWLVRGY